MDNWKIRVVLNFTKMKQQYLCYVYTRHDIILNNDKKVLETQYSISMHDIYNETIPAG